MPDLSAISRGHAKSERGADSMPVNTTAETAHQTHQRAASTATGPTRQAMETVEDQPRSMQYNEGRKPPDTTTERHEVMSGHGSPYQ